MSGTFKACFEKHEGMRLWTGFGTHHANKCRSNVQHAIGNRSPSFGSTPGDTFKCHFVPTSKPLRLPKCNMKIFKKCTCKKN